MNDELFIGAITEEDIARMMSVIESELNSRKVDQKEKRSVEALDALKFE